MLSWYQSPWYPIWCLVASETIASALLKSVARLVHFQFLPQIQNPWLRFPDLGFLCWPLKPTLYVIKSKLSLKSETRCASFAVRALNIDLDRCDFLFRIIEAQPSFYGCSLSTAVDFISKYLGRSLVSVSAMCCRQ